MRTALDLIFEWQSAQEAKKRCDQEAAEAAKHALDLDTRLKALLRQHGPVRCDSEIFRAPDTPDAPVIHEPCPFAGDVLVHEEVDSAASQ